MERKKTNEIYMLNFDNAIKTGKATATRGVSFFWEDVLKLTESTVIKNCTAVKTTYDEFTINEQFDLVDGEWQSYLKRQSLGIPKHE